MNQAVKTRVEACFVVKTILLRVGAEYSIRQQKNLSFWIIPEIIFLSSIRLF
jgi:hypothetical protein